MSANALYLHYKSLLRESPTVAECDQIIESAFNDYLKDRITYEEYGKIYFAAIDVINSYENGTQKAG